MWVPPRQTAVLAVVISSFRQDVFTPCKQQSLSIPRQNHASGGHLAQLTHHDNQQQLQAAFTELFVESPQPFSTSCTLAGSPAATEERGFCFLPVVHPWQSAGPWLTCLLLTGQLSELQQ